MSSEIYDPSKYVAPDDDALRAARDEVEKHFLGQPLIHTVKIGEIRKEGQTTGEIGVVVQTEHKMSAQSLIQQGLDPIPPVVVVPCQRGAKVEKCEVRVDVQQVPKPKDQRLRLYDKEDLRRIQHSPYAGINDWRGCHNAPLPGGVQIAPERAGWVGTLSGFCTFIDKQTGKRVIGAFTNYHVAMSSRQRGIKIGQPDGSSGDWFAQTVDWSPMQGNQNRVDCAVLDTFRSGGPPSAPDRYGDGRHLVRPYSYKIGEVVPDPVLQHRIGDLVQKSGRTTGHTKGRVTGVEATSQIDYGADGVLQFVGQTTVRGDASLFSDSGDSGSHVLSMDRRPYGLLFAGGGGETLINRIEDVMKMFDMQFAA